MPEHSNSVVVDIMETFFLPEVNVRQRRGVVSGSGQSESGSESNDKESNDLTLSDASDDLYEFITDLSTHKPAKTFKNNTVFEKKEIDYRSLDDLKYHVESSSSFLASSEVEGEIFYRVRVDL